MQIKRMVIKYNFVYFVLISIHHINKSRNLIIHGIIQEMNDGNICSDRNKNQNRGVVGIGTGYIPFQVKVRGKHQRPSLIFHGAESTVE